MDISDLTDVLLSRWEAVTGGNLDKSERERLFDEHIDHLIGEISTLSNSILT